MVGSATCALADEGSLATPRWASTTRRSIHVHRRGTTIVHVVLVDDVLRQTAGYVVYCDTVGGILPSAFFCTQLAATPPAGTIRVDVIVQDPAFVGPIACFLDMAIAGTIAATFT